MFGLSKLKEKQNNKDKGFCYCDAPTKYTKEYAKVVKRTLGYSEVHFYCTFCDKPINKKPIVGIDSNELPRVEQRLIDIRDLDEDKSILPVVRTKYPDQPICFTGHYYPDKSDLASIQDVLESESKGYEKEAKDHYILLEDGLYIFEEDDDTWYRLVIIRDNRTNL
ncbi:hypothetical protein COF68_05420 [Bacillus toyonensis]|uniref:hypothetical protein n=1 Tax=Bacillus toyonensis TaxID=155322 RepID=UPI000BFC2E2A|nr:hypothetical protein [Bacillus toyonensis]PHE64282.1 hypothetical protein COF68_05420 [Bacillus toyonensis]